MQRILQIIMRLLRSWRSAEDSFWRPIRYIDSLFLPIALFAWLLIILDTLRRGEPDLAFFFGSMSLIIILAGYWLTRDV